MKRARLEIEDYGLKVSVTQSSPGAGSFDDPMERFVRAYFIGFIPRSLHIFLARSSLISVCRGTDERLF